MEKFGTGLPRAKARIPCPFSAIEDGWMPRSCKSLVIGTCDQKSILNRARGVAQPDPTLFIITWGGAGHDKSWPLLQVVSVNVLGFSTCHATHALFRA